MIRYNENIDYRLELVSDRVVRKRAKLCTKKEFDLIRAVCNHFINYPDPLVVPIYNFDVISVEERGELWYDSLYSYDMMRLGMLDRNEKTFIIHHRLGERSDHFNELSNFLNEVKSQKRYHDIHEGNIMKDEEDNFRLIDIEGFFNFSSKLGSRDFDWVIR